jgi:hypothetical protein
MSCYCRTSTCIGNNFILVILLLFLFYYFFLIFLTLFFLTLVFLSFFFSSFFASPSLVFSLSFFGRLLYLTHSIPDISYVVSKLIQFLDAPKNEHMLASLHVLIFLKKHPGQGLFFCSSSPLTLKRFFDSNRDACPNTRRLTTDFRFFLGTSIISWKSKKAISSIKIFTKSRV